MPMDMAGALQQKLAELMQDPNAMRGMQNYMQGLPPTAGMPQMPQGGGQMPMPMPQGGPPQGDMPMEMPEGGEQDMVNAEIDRKGATWDGVDAPTQNDIERLRAEPTETNIQSFDAQFGDGMAEQYLGDTEEAAEGEAPPPGEEAMEGEEPEY